MDEHDKEIRTTILQSEWAADVAKGLKRLLGINQVKLSRVLRKIILLRLHAQKSPWNTFHYVIMIIVYLNHLNCLHFFVQYVAVVVKTAREGKLAHLLLSTYPRKSAGYNSTVFLGTAQISRTYQSTTTGWQSVSHRQHT